MAFCASFLQHTPNKKSVRVKKALHWKQLDIAWNRYNQGGNIRGGREYKGDEHINLEVLFSLKKNAPTED